MSEGALVPLPPREPSGEEKRADLIQLVIDSVPSENSKRAYRTGLEIFFRWWSQEAPGSSFSRALVQRYRSALEAAEKSASTINQRLAPVRKLAEETAAAGLLSPSAASDVRAVKGAKQRGTRKGNWLTREQAEQLLLLPKRDTLRGKRDYALLCLLLAAGLRREELAALERKHIEQRDGRWCLVDLVGKGKRVRTVAIPEWTREAVEEWLAALPAQFQTGRVLGKVNKGGRYVGQGMTPSAIYGVVRRYAAQLGITLRPHDLRRTYGKLAHKGGAKIEQIQLSYGHASLTTTERYLGIDQDLADAPCDHLQLNPQPAKATEKPAPAPPAKLEPPGKTVQLRVSLMIENNSKFTRGKKKAREWIEDFHLSRYEMRCGSRPNEYEITVPYENDAELDEIIEELLGEIRREADLRNCYAETLIEEVGGAERRWG